MAGLIFNTGKKLARLMVSGRGLGAGDEIAAISRDKNDAKHKPNDDGQILSHGADLNRQPDGCIQHKESHAPEAKPNKTGDRHFSGKQPNDDSSEQSAPLSPYVDNFDNNNINTKHSPRFAPHNTNLHEINLNNHRLLDGISAGLKIGVEIEKFLSKKSTWIAILSIIITLVALCVSGIVGLTAYWQNERINAPGVPQIQVGFTKIIERWTNTREEFLNEALLSGKHLLGAINIKDTKIRPNITDNSGTIVFLPTNNQIESDNPTQEPDITSDAVADWLKNRTLSIGIRYPSERKKTIEDMGHLSKLEFTVRASCKDISGYHPIIEIDLIKYKKDTYWTDPKINKGFYGDHTTIDNDSIKTTNGNCSSKIRSIRLFTESKR